MSKKDYETIANALKPFYQPMWRDTDIKIIDVITALSKAMSKDNPKFNPVRFLDYIRQ